MRGNTTELGAARRAEQDAERQLQASEHMLTRLGDAPEGARESLKRQIGRHRDHFEMARDRRQALEGTPAPATSAAGTPPSPEELARQAAADEAERQDREELARETQLARRISIPAGTASVGREPRTYERGNGQSMFRDMLQADRGNAQARERLARHMEEVRVDRPEQFDLSSTDSAGGYLVAPLYLQDELVTVARPKRPMVDAIGVRPLPPSTDTINIPTIATGTEVAVQSSDNSGIQETDATFSTIAAAVKTIAGMQDVSLQVVDRGLPGTDDVIFGDLLADYDTKFDSLVLNSATSNFLGLLQVSGTNAVTYTDTTATVAEFYRKLASAFNEIATGIYAAGNLVGMHPRRWAWLLSESDSQSRPLVLPAANMPQNSVATMNVNGAEGAVGTILGAPVVLDANIPSTGGAGTNEDTVIVVRREECFIWEDPRGPYLMRFDDVGSGTLTVRFRLHNYVAQAHGRRPDAISKITGTGLTAPTF